MQIKLTRSKLESLADPLLTRTKAPCISCLKDAGIKKEDINDVLLVGGMSRMPIVSGIVKEIYGKDPSKGVNPDEAVAMGAAIQGRTTAIEEIMRVFAIEEVMIAFPAWEKSIFSQTGKASMKTVVL